MIYHTTETVEHALKFMRSYCYEMRHLGLLEREIDLFGAFVEENGNPAEITEYEEIRQRLAEGLAYERVHGPASRLNWDNPIVAMAERARAAKGWLTRKEILAAWLSAKVQV